MACREPVSGFGTGLRARTSADQLFGALADRHYDIVRNAKYEYARVQLARGALSPSRVFDDSATWTAISGPVRILETFGTATDDHYTMSSRRGVPAPQKPADGRHVTTLSRLTENQFRWDTSVDFALGSVRPDDIALVFARLLTAGEGRTEREARADVATSAQHTAAALASVFSLDTLRPVVLGDGSTQVTVTTQVHSELLRPRFPAFADYVHKYVDPARFRFTLSDRAGVAYIDGTYRDRLLTFHLRSRGGQLVPIGGGSHVMPDTLVLLADFTVKVKMFNVGFHDLSLEFVNSAHGSEERDWTVTGKREPQWNLPFITARLLRAPLRFPFSGEGALFRMGVRAGEGDRPTVLVRQARLGVQESAILKFVNSLTSTAIDEFGTRVEREENQWLRELFAAMRDDAHGALNP
ncbi:MAG: hypothetical protein ABIY52_14730 [Gemmatimonadaceae bacterium]